MLIGFKFISIKLKLEWINISLILENASFEKGRSKKF